MDYSLVCAYAVVLGYLGVTAYLANVEQRGDESVVGLKALMLVTPGVIGLLALFVVMAASVPNEPVDPSIPDDTQQVETIDISATTVVVSLLLCVVAGGFAYTVIASDEVRQGVQRLLVRAGGKFDATSMVHTAALVFSVMLLVVSTVIFILEGGTSGMSEQFEESGADTGLIVFQTFLQVAFAFLGVGYAIRRMMPATLRRLGLRAPTDEDVRWGLATTAGLLGVALTYGALMSIFFTPDQLEEQGRAAESMLEAYSTIPLALLISSGAAMGEEIFFRGALQPVFGLVPTAAFFTLLHTQVLLTPGMILIFAIGLGLGWVRMRYSTTSSIIAHFGYNMVILLISILQTSGGGT
jgi:hypothetical protein